jgi:hypothetical protein
MNPIRRPTAELLSLAVREALAVAHRNLDHPDPVVARRAARVVADFQKHLLELAARRRRRVAAAAARAAPPPKLYPAEAIHRWMTARPKP